MSAAHTSGPWVHHAYDNIITAEGREHATLIEWQPRSLHVSVAERDANGRLIAAVPELLEACQAMIAWDDREKDHAVDFYARMALCIKAFEKARAAIAKATGEAS